MQIYSETGDFKLYHGSMLDMLQVIQPNSVDAVVTDPPYELNFMGKGWDNSGIAFQADTWRKCYQVLKHGGYLLAFGGTRTFHRIACAIEDAGFEIRDTIMWLYGSGFPKSMNIGLAIDKRNGIDSPVVATGRSGAADTHARCMNSLSDDGSEFFGGEYEIRQAQNEWAGWGTALKPAYEPVIVARKPCEGSCVDNVLQHGVGGMNIDACRVGATGGVREKNIIANSGSKNCGFGCDGEIEPIDAGRYPSNVILTYDESDKAEVCGGMPNTKSNGGLPNDEKTTSIMNVPFADHKSGLHYEDEGSAARYFYCAKASKRDRDEGLDAFVEQRTTDGSLRCNEELAPNIRAVSSLHRNTHPTVKPVDLMQYLVRLVTPKGGTVLDPFNGSGSTGKAVMYENRDRAANYKYIGIELTAEYLPIADARIRYAAGDNSPVEMPDKPLQGQITFFDILGG